MILVKRRTSSETEGTDERGGGTVRACNINPFNKLIIDEIYRAFTGGGANVLHLSQGNSGYISGLAPLRLDLRACANEPRSPHQPRRGGDAQDDAAALRSATVTRTQCGSWTSLKICRRWGSFIIFTILYYLVSFDRNSREHTHKVLTVSCLVQLTGIDKFSERYFPSLSIASFHRRC